MSFSELIAVYLFLGGASAGAFTLVAFADVAGHVWNRSRARAESTSLRSSFATIPESTRRYVQTFVYGTGLVSILAGVLCLVADLGRPEAFYYPLPLSDEQPGVDRRFRLDFFFRCASWSRSRMLCLDCLWRCEGSYLS